jgi:hypothetical protein
MTKVSGYPVSQQHKGPGMPKQVKDIDWPFQRAGHQHPELFNNVWLREKWGKSQQQHERDKEFIVEQIIHYFSHPLQNQHKHLVFALSF